MFAAHRAAYLEYHQQVIAVAIDIYNLEAEAYGACVAASTPDAIPAIHQPLLKSIEEGINLKPFDPERDGRIAMVLSVAKRLKQEFPGADVRLPVGRPLFDRLQPARDQRSVPRCGVVSRSVGQVAHATGREPGCAVPCGSEGRTGRGIFRVGCRSADPFAQAVPRVGNARSASRVGDRFGMCRASRALHLGRKYVPGLGRLAIDRHELSRMQRGNQPGGIRRASIAYASAREGPHQSRPRAWWPCHDPQRIYRAIDHVLEITAGRDNCVMGTGAMPLETPPSNIRLIPRISRLITHRRAFSPPHA